MNGDDSTHCHDLHFSVSTIKQITVPIVGLIVGLGMEYTKFKNTPRNRSGEGGVVTKHKEAKIIVQKAPKYLQ